MSFSSSSRLSVRWDWYLARTRDMQIIEGLPNAKGRKLTLALNDRESANFTLSMFEPAAPKIKAISTCLLAYRNNKLTWSGPIWTVSKKIPDMSVQVGCLGWFEFLNHYLLKTGSLVPAGYGDSGVMTATSLQFAGIDQSIIAANMLQRGIVDAQQGLGTIPGGAPVFVNLGSVPFTGFTRNITYQEFKNIGQAITELAQMESGFDFRVDPATRQFNIYFTPVGPAGTTINGRGKVQPNALFAYKTGVANIQNLSENEDGSTVQNDVFAVGPYGVGIGYDYGSQNDYGIFSSQASLSDVTQAPVLNAFANAEAITNARPRKIWTFDQMPYLKGGSAMQPFIDFDIGDFCNLISNYGIILPDPSTGLKTQPIRIFGFTVNVSDEGVEQVTNFQTAYQQHS